MIHGDFRWVAPSYADQNMHAAIRAALLLMAERDAATTAEVMQEMATDRFTIDPSNFD